MTLIFFLALTFGLSSIFWTWSFSGAPLQQVAPLLMWMPGVSALIVQLATYRTLDGLGWRLGSWRYLAFAVSIPIAYCLAIYVPVWLTGLGGLESNHLVHVLPALPLLIIVNLPTALGEEIGWRGFLVPGFYRTSGFAGAGIATGIIWALWHVPLIVVGGYNAGTPLWYGIACFITSVTGISVMLAWLRLRSDSLWPAAVFHASHNVVIQGVFDPATIDTGTTKWITTEFGIGLTILMVVIGVTFWRKRGELPAPHPAGVPLAVQP